MKQIVALLLGLFLLAGTLTACSENAPVSSQQTAEEESLSSGEKKTAQTDPLSPPQSSQSEYLGVKENGEYRYRDYKDHVEIYGYLGKGGDVVVPAEIDGKPVWKLEEAFKEQESITAVTVSQGIREIGINSFHTCSNLKKVTVPSSVQSIGSLAFWKCTALEEVILQEGLTKIGDGAFNHCTSLKSIVLPQSVSYLGVMAFDACESLEQVTIPTSLPDIGGCAFRDTPFEASFAEFGIVGDGILIVYNGEAAKAVIPEGVKVISGSFENCFHLKEVVIPDTVTNIGEYAFWGCKNLGSVSIPGGVTRIDSDAFVGCEGLTSVIVPPSVVELGSEIFARCKSLSAVTLSPNCTWITSKMFQNCTSMTSLSIPASVERLANDAFQGCAALAELKFEGGNVFIQDSAFADCKELQIVCPKGSVVEDYAKNNKIPCVNG